MEQSNSKITDEILNLAEVLWNYHHMNQSPKLVDLIMVLGNSDLRTAERGSELYLQKLAPTILFSGGFGKLTKDIWNESEAEKFAEIAIKMDVPENKILVENKSTNTGENITFSYQLLKEKNLIPKSLILVQKPYLERRSFATFKKLWPEPDTEIIVTSPQISFENYPTEDLPIKKVINLMVGDLQRIKEYPAKGFQIEQDIPPEVWNAYEKLVKLGFTEQLIKD